ncbi:MAG: cation-transporting P-type ATPase [Rhodospirillaceae bacterium]|nr:cation-transporting P-type ATPase [Rhodospirillaceae bacterium]
MRQSFDAGRLSGLADPGRGLTAAEAAARRQLHGRNDILERSEAGWRDIARDTLRDPMIWFLVLTALLFAWLGDWVEAAVLGAALLPIIGMDAYLHRRTLASIEGLAGRLAARAQVIRDGAPCSIAAAELVVGDLVLLESGDALPADGLIVAGENMQVDESALTGESFPVRKHAFAGAMPSAGAVVVEERHWGAAGTRLLAGQGRLRVARVGAETLYGQIVRSARQGRQERTPLQHAIGSLVSWLLAAAVLLCIVLAVTRYLQGYGLLDAFLSAVTLAVAALPEEFPIVFTFFLGVGVYRLAHRQALVRRAVVVENIGRITCICSDKTGTLTEGRLHLSHVQPAAGSTAEACTALAASAARPDSGDPLDQALLAAAKPIAGALVAAFPFTEDRRRETAVLRDGDGRLLAVLKGAPETVLAQCDLEPEQRASWLARTAELAAGGHKIIASARRSLTGFSGAEPQSGFALAGMLAFEDPVREGVVDAVAGAMAAGIRIIMVTGDHPATARTIAAEIGIGADATRKAAPEVIDGAQLAERLARDPGDTLADIDVVARAVPAQKLALVQALQRGGEIVAVTGDGVNDAPALRGADIGIAMGERGTRTAREVAAIVLLDDNFRTIVRAIGEGQQLFRNLKLSFAYLLMVHLPLVLTAALIPFLGFPLLYLPMHVVWLELIIHPTVLLVFQELPDRGRLDPVRRKERLRFFDRREWGLILLVAGLVTAILLLGYWRGLGPTQAVEHARSMALVSFACAMAAVVAGLSRCRTRAALLAIAATVASAVLLVEFAPAARLLHLTPLHVDDWLLAAAGGAVGAAAAALFPQQRATPRRSRQGSTGAGA